MAIFRCKKCAYMKEIGNIYIDKKIKCPKCKQVNSIYDTLAFINALIKRYVEVEQSKLLQDKQSLASESGSLETCIDDSASNISLTEIDIHETDILTKPNNLEPIKQWFEKRNIEINIDPDAADTTGFFDEVALLIGNNFSLLCGVIKQIVHIQNKDYKTVKIDLAKYSAKETKQIVSFCKTLHEYSFVARNAHIKKDQNIYLTLQRANKIKQFFNGFWMEWFVLITLLNFFKEQKTVFSMTRGLEIFSTQDNYNEIDLFCLTEQKNPIFIECKSGEYQQDIEKYLSFQKMFQKRLKLNKCQFIVCVFGLDQKQARGLTQTYEQITFVNETSLIDHLRSICC